MVKFMQLDLIADSAALKFCSDCFGFLQTWGMPVWVPRPDLPVIARDSL